MGRWLLWTLLLAGWTSLLVMPVPPPEELPLGEYVWSHKFLIAKTIHVAGYAFLTAASMLLPMPHGWRWVLAVLLILHGAGTEWIQAQLPYRDGNLRDVALDALGVLLGVVVMWVVRLKRRPV